MPYGQTQDNRLSTGAALGGAAGASTSLYNVGDYLARVHPEIVRKIRAGKEYKPGIPSLRKLYRNARVGDVIAEGGVHDGALGWFADWMYGVPTGHATLKVEPRKILHSGTGNWGINASLNSDMKNVGDHRRGLKFGDPGVSPHDWGAQQIAEDYIRMPKNPPNALTRIWLKHKVPLTPSQIAKMQDYLKANVDELKNYDVTKATLNGLRNLVMPRTGRGGGRCSKGSICYTGPMNVLSLLGKGWGEESEGLTALLTNPNLEVGGVYNKARAIEMLRKARGARVAAGLAAAGAVGGAGALAGRGISNMINKVEDTRHPWRAAWNELTKKSAYAGLDLLLKYAYSARQKREATGKGLLGGLGGTLAGGAGAYAGLVPMAERAVPGAVSAAATALKNGPIINTPQALAAAKAMLMRAALNPLMKAVVGVAGLGLAGGAVGTTLGVRSGLKADTFMEKVRAALGR